MVYYLALLYSSTFLIVTVLFFSLIKVSVMFLLAWKITASLVNSSLRPRITTTGVHQGMQGYAKDESDVQEGHGMLNEMTNVSG